MSTTKTTALGTRLVGLADSGPHDQGIGIGLATRTATARKDRGDAPLAWSVAAAADNDTVIGSIPVQDGDTTVTIHSGNTDSVFAISSVGVVTIADKSSLVAGSPYTLVLRV